MRNRPKRREQGVVGSTLGGLGGMAVGALGGLATYAALQPSCHVVSGGAGHKTKPVKPTPPPPPQQIPCLQGVDCLVPQSLDEVNVTAERLDYVCSSPAGAGPNPTMQYIGTAAQQRAASRFIPILQTRGHQTRLRPWRTVLSLGAVRVARQALLRVE
jgi:hypothetical protein